MPSKMGTKTNRIVENVLQIKSYLACPPGKPEAFSEYWELIVRDFPHDHFRPSDTPILEQYIETEIQRKKVAAKLEKEGYVVRGPHGSKPNPLVAVLTQLSGQVRACARMLRISPVSRMAVGSVPKTPARAPVAEGAPAGRRVVKLAGVEPA